MTVTWDKLYILAAELYRKDPTECMRHARVSADNKHKCMECFTCACLAVVRNRALRGH